MPTPVAKNARKGGHSFSKSFKFNFNLKADSGLSGFKNGQNIPRRVL